MTVLAAAPIRGIPWSALRLAAGLLLFFAGLFFLMTAYHQRREDLVGLGVMLLAAGGALSFEKSAEQVMIPVGAIFIALIPFSIFILLIAQKNPFTVVKLMYEGAFGGWFSFQNTLTRAAPLMLTGLCTALPMRIGMVIIGGEGALVIGALMAAGMGHYAQIHEFPAWLVITSMLVVGALSGGLWITLAGALKHYRGVNETISSLLLIYIGIAIMNHLVEGAWRDPASLNKPSTWPITTPDGDMIMGSMPHMDVHWGLVIGIVTCIVCWIIMNKTTFGFGAQIVGGNVRAAKVAGLSIGRIIIITCMLAGGAAGLAGAVEIAAVQGAANATIVAGYGYTGILVAFLARQNSFAVIPVAILIGGIAASGGLLQRRLGLPDATVNVLQGFIFIVILASETYYGKLKIFQKKETAFG